MSVDSGAIRVVKFGGTSLADADLVAAAAQKVVSLADGGYSVVVVVSAQGGTTNELLSAARAIARKPSAREVDQLLITGEAASAALLAMAVDARGRAATSLVGVQTGIRAQGRHGWGRMAEIDRRRIDVLLHKGHVVVVAGFHGVTFKEEVLTLGRGGSDTAAVGLAAALGASDCEIYTDVDGVFTADPHLVPAARLLAGVSAEVMVEMSYAGARVLHPRAVDLALRSCIDIHVRNSLRPSTGTTVFGGLRKGIQGMIEDSGAVVGVAHDRAKARVMVWNRPSSLDCTPEFLGALAEESIEIDVVVRQGSSESGFELDFVVSLDQLDAVFEAAAELGLETTSDRNIATVSLVGTRMLERPGILSRSLSSLRSSRIEVKSFSVAQNRISLIVPEEHSGSAVNVLHRSMGLASRRDCSGSEVNV